MFFITFTEKTIILIFCVVILNKWDQINVMTLGGFHYISIFMTNLLLNDSAIFLRVKCEKMIITLVTTPDHGQLHY